MLAKTFQGLEEVLAEELRELRARNVRPIRRGVEFEGDLLLLYRANLHLRTALRILRPIHSFRARNERQLYAGVQAVDWRQYLRLSQTFAIDPVVNSPIFRHSHFAGLKTKDAIVDQFRRHTGQRPSIDTRKPHLRISLHINDTQVSLSLDSSGQSLHKRGYRHSGHPAPLNEVLAAGLLKIAGWEGKGTLLDPMCGTGTIPIEAAMIAENRPPNLHRRQFGFHRWPDFDRATWNKTFAMAEENMRASTAKIYGRDVAGQSVRLATRQEKFAKLGGPLDFDKGDFFKQAAPDPDGGLLIMNPPYGERLQETDMADFYKRIGDTFKQHYPGYTAWVFTSNVSALKRLGLRAEQKAMLHNGPLECRFQKYTLYAGKKES